MKVFRIGLHSLVLTLTDIVAILFGFWMYKLILIQRQVDQIIVQAPIALVFCVLAFAVWSWLVRRLVNQLSLRGRDEYLWTYLAALLWSPALCASTLRYPRLPDGYRKHNRVVGLSKSGEHSGASPGPLV